MKKSVVVLCLGVLCLGVSFAAAASVGDVRLKGFLGERLDRMVERHVGGTDVDYVTACFLEKTERHGWWQTEFWGKYMHAAVPFAAYSGSAKIASDVRRGVDRILASQEECGYVGNYPDELRCGEGWDVWMAFTATLPIGSHHENPEGALPETVTFCDFASAGNTWRRDNHYRTWFPVEYGPAE